jgi:hypothetical protein
VEEADFVDTSARRGEISLWLEEQGEGKGVPFDGLLREDGERGGCQCCSLAEGKREKKKRTFLVKWRQPRHHLVRQRSQCPPVDSTRIALAAAAGYV